MSLPSSFVTGGYMWQLESNVVCQYMMLATLYSSMTAFSIPCHSDTRIFKVPSVYTNLPTAITPVYLGYLQRIDISLENSTIPSSSEALLRVFNNRTRISNTDHAHSESLSNVSIRGTCIPVWLHGLGTRHQRMR
jgi:hypothetical protein